MTNSISCPVCNNLCSTQATACPKCGHPISPTIQTVEVKNADANQNPLLTAEKSNVLRIIFWFFFAFSLYYALVGIRLWIDMPRPVYGYNDAEISENMISIVFHFAPLILAIIVLALTYLAKKRQ